MPVLSAAQASFAERWETMETMVCSIFSGVKSDVCASVDRLRAPVNLETGAVVCSLVSEIIPVSGVAVVVVVVVLVIGSAAGGWEVVAGLETGLDPGETMPGDGESPAGGPTGRGISVWKVSQGSEAEPSFLEIGDAS